MTADLALFAVLFTDGMHVSFPSLRAAWRNPARALGLGMPLAFLFMELAKFAGPLVFGALLTLQLFGDLSPGGYVAVILAIVLIRPASLLLSLIGTHFDRREKLAAAWFGPKGFASVVYGLLVLQSGIPQAEQAYTLIAVCIAFSIIAHSSTDVPVARMFRVNDLVGIPDADQAGHHDSSERNGTEHART